MKKIQLLFLFWVCISAEVFCQPDSARQTQFKDRNMFGLHIPRGLKINCDGLADGYIMFVVPNSPLVFLINRRGELVHQWKGNYGVSHAYLMDDGSIFQGAEDPDFPVFGCCGPFGRIQKVSWDGKMLWDYEIADEQRIVHHDFTVMPNGHVLAIIYEVMSYDKAIALGRPPEKTPKSGPWSEAIIEIVPDGKRGGKIVWEWHLWDHLVQGSDPKKANYGKPAEHPELLDFSLGHPLPPPITQEALDEQIAQGRAHRNSTVDNQHSDIYHFNAIKYNPDLDQIVFSSQVLDEIYIIDHSTTIKEAASHKGGRSGKGGDFLYRWGNPQNYQRGDSTNKQLFGQHDVRWIEQGKPGAGHLTVYNNHLPENITGEDLMSTTNNRYSAIYEIAIPVDKAGKYLIEEGKPFGPEQPAWKYIAPDTLSFYSSFVSGAHRMENGNTFIVEGARGRFFEVTPEGRTVWEYLNPYHGDIHQLNGDPVSPIPFAYWAFRSTFIPAYHPAFAGKKLQPIVPQPQPFFLPAGPPR